MGPCDNPQGRHHRRKSEFPKLLAAPQSLQQQLGALLISLRLVKLLILFGNVMRIGDPPVDELRCRSDAPTFLDFLGRQEGQNSVHQKSGIERWSARASKGAFSAARLSMARAALIDAPCLAAASSNSLRRASGPNSYSLPF